MKHLLHYSTCIIAILLLISCQQGNRSLALKQSEIEIDSLIKQKDYYSASFRIDSMEGEFSDIPGADSIILDLRHSIKKSEAQDNIKYLDSTEVTNSQDIDKYLKSFIYEDPGISLLQGRYIHKSQQIKNNYSRSFLRANIRDDGTFYISSHYTGTYPIKHNQISVNQAEYFVKTDPVPEDGGFNRRYDDGNGTYFEVVYFKNGKDQGVAEFIATNADKRLLVTLMSKEKKKSTYYLSKLDKQSIALALEFSEKIKERQRIQEEKNRLQQIINRP